MMFRTKHVTLMTLSGLLTKHTSIYDHANTEHTVAGSYMSPWP
jgi:hypothetical protein